MGATSVYSGENVKVIELGSPHPQYVRLRVDADGIWFGEHLAFERAGITSAAIRVGDRYSVHVRATDAHASRVFGSFGDRAEAEAVVEALGVPSVRVCVVGECEASLVPVGFEESGFWTTLAAFGWETLTAAVRGLFRAPVLSARALGIGEDGLAIRSSLAGYPFLPYARLLGVQTTSEELVLVLEGDRLVPLRLANASRLEEVAGIVAARRGWPRAAGPPAVSRALQNLAEEPDPTRRIGRLREIAGTTQTYRRVAATREELWEVLEATGESVVVRALAAVALGLELSLGERDRLRIVASTTAHPELRSLLDAGRVGDARLAKLLREIERAAQPR